MRWKYDMIDLQCDKNKGRDATAGSRGSQRERGKETGKGWRVGTWVVGGCLCCVSLPPWGVGAISRMRPSVTIVKRT